jgi:hypothetical protein
MSATTDEALATQRWACFACGDSYGPVEGEPCIA